MGPRACVRREGCGGLARPTLPRVYDFPLNLGKGAGKALDGQGQGIQPNRVKTGLGSRGLGTGDRGRPSVVLGTDGAP